MLKKSSLLMLFASSCFCFVAAFVFIQTSFFAGFVKGFISNYLLEEAGVSCHFTEFSIQFIPPGFSVIRPQLLLEKKNPVGLPSGSLLTAKRIDFVFKLLHILSGRIRVHEVKVVGGNLDLILSSASFNQNKTLSSYDQNKTLSSYDQNKTLSYFDWDTLLNIRAEKIAFQDVGFYIHSDDSKNTLKGYAKIFRFGQWSGKGGLGYFLNLDLENMELKSHQLFKNNYKIHQINGEMRLNAAGLEVSSLLLRHQNLELFFSGKVLGNLKKSKNSKWIADSDLRMKGDLSSLYQAVPIQWAKKLPTGEVSFHGKLHGDLQNPFQTFQVEGELLGKNFIYDKWGVDSLRAEGSWSAATEKSSFILKKALLVSEPRPKGVFVDQPGWGGKIEIGPSKWIVGSSDPISIPLEMENVHLHWLAAPAVRSVFPLDFRLNGRTRLSLSLPSGLHSWKLKTSFEKLELEKFQFKKIFNIQKVFISGDALIDSKCFSPIDTLVYVSKNTQFSVKGRVDWSKGYDLHATGMVHLEDLKEIAENEIRGDGKVTVDVHGPSSNVFIDISIDLKNADYLGLQLGEVVGKIVWEDDPEHLCFRDFFGNKNETKYAVKGHLDFSGVPSIQLAIQIIEGDIQNLIQILSEKITSFSWFPREIHGAVVGDIQVTGGFELRKLKVLGQLSGVNWECYREKFKDVHLVGGYDQGSYRIDQFHIIKKRGSIFGHVGIEANQTMNWEVHTHHLTLSDFDYIAPMDIPLRGEISIESSGEGVLNSVHSVTHIELPYFAIRGRVLPKSHFVLKYDHGLAQWIGTCFGEQARFNLDYYSHPKALSQFSLEFKEFDFTSVLLILNPKSIQDELLSGSISGSAQLTFHSDEIEKATGKIMLSEFFLKKTGSKFYNLHPIFFEISNGDFKIQNATLSGKEGQLQLALEAKQGNINGNLKGELDTSVLEFFIPSLLKSSGLATVHLVFSGSLKEPSITGTTSFSGASMNFLGLGSSLENITGVFSLQQNSLKINNFHFNLGGGYVKAHGEVILFLDRYPQVQIQGLLNKTQIKIYPFQFAKLNGNLNVVGLKPPYEISGNIFVDSALCKEKLMKTSHNGMGLKSVQYSPDETRQKESGNYKFKLNINVDAQKDILIQNDFFKDTQIKGRIAIVNSLDSPSLLGSVEAVHGKIIFKGYEFQIQNGVVKFNNLKNIAPFFDLNAHTEMSGIKVQLSVSGNPDKMKIGLISIPPMQEAEILSLLTMGLTSNEAKRLSATDLSAVQQGEAASLVLHSLDLNRHIEEKTGFKLELDEAINSQHGVSVFRPQSQTDGVAAPQITIRKKLGDRLSLSAGSTMGLSTNQSNQVNLDFSLTDGFSFMGVFNNYGVYGTGVSADTQPIQNSVGLDLKFQKRFK